MRKTSWTEWYCNWTTRNELDFVAGLGRHGRARESRQVLLRRYLEAARQRVEWGNVESEIVIDAVRSELNGGGA